MDESELEARLRRRLHERFDGRDAPSELRAAVVATTAARPSATRWRATLDFLFSGSRQLLAAVAVVVVVVIVGIALTGRESSTGIPSISPSPNVSLFPSSTPPASPPPSTVSAEPTGPLASVPAISRTAWSGLSLAQLTSAPEVSMVVPWARGYVAIEDSSSAGQLGAWLSRDGRTWVQLPAGTFGLDDPTHDTFVIGGAACGNGVLIVGEDASGNETLWISSDGDTWRQEALPGTFSQVRETFIAGSQAGAILAGENGPAVDVTTDCSTWRRVDLSGPATTQISAIAVFGTGYVALDSSSPAAGSQPHAWWSSDGINWSEATVHVAKGDDFSSVWAGAGGLLAESHLGGAPGLDSLWSSTDGHAWTKNGPADPFGVRLSGEGVGDPAGSIVGDGTRFLAFGFPGDDQTTSFEFLASPDGAQWTPLTLQGDVPSRLADARWGFLMRDGVLISGDAGTWFGTAVTK
jgi:hypothetical protein